MKCPACGASNGPGRSTCSSCMRPIGNQPQTDPANGPRYRSWSQESGQRPAYVASPASESPPQDQQVSAQNLDPAVAQEYYRQQADPRFGGAYSGPAASGPPPPEASGLTMAGCLPFGLFALFNGQFALGLLGLVTSFLGPIYWVYSLIVMFSGKRLAWHGRRFSDGEEYRQVMDAWNSWAIGYIVASFIGGLIIGWQSAANLSF